MGWTVTREHQRSVEREQRRQRQPEPAPQAEPAAVVLGLQRAYGNRAVGRVLARNNHTPGSGPDYRFGTGGIAKETLKDERDLDDAVEAVIEDHFDGVRAMFLQNAVAKTLADWTDLVFSHMDPFYDGKAFGRPQVLAAMRRLKDEHRGGELIHIAETLYFEAGDRHEHVVHDGPSLRAVLQAKGAYLEDADDVALQAIFDTEGKFAATEVEIARGNLQLLDEDGYVVVMDDHQNKHQAEPIPEFKTYTGEPGNKFAFGKDLAWHRDHTVPVVLQTMKDAVTAKAVTQTRNFSPSKDAIDGINYDLTISYDEPTGKWVGVYHCNPYDDERS